MLLSQMQLQCHQKPRQLQKVTLIFRSMLSIFSNFVATMNCLNPCSGLCRLLCLLSMNVSNRSPTVNCLNFGRGSYFGVRSLRHNQCQNWQGSNATTTQNFFKIFFTQSNHLQKTSKLSRYSSTHTNICSTRERKRERGREKRLIYYIIMSHISFLLIIIIILFFI